MPVVAIFNAVAYSVFGKFIFSNQFLKTFNDRKYSLLIIFPILMLVYINSGILKEYKSTAARLLYERRLGIDRQDLVADFVRENTVKSDTVLSWGAIPSVNFLAKRNSPTPYLFYPAYEKSPYTEEMGMLFFQKIRSNPPIVIVDTFRASPDYILSLDPTIRQSQLKHKKILIYQNTPYQCDFFIFVEENYQRIETINSFDIYVYSK
ncbi:MAG: hypothetical protein GY755_07845 [Chloroflexi bacterium]|nr:hypothetical protein [Chloroflexota bacterium]